MMRVGNCDCGWSDCRVLSVLLLGLCLGVVGGERVHAQVLVNEAQSANASTLEDEDGDHEDWIEILNAGAAAVDLAGYRLSDDPLQPDMWVFPSISLDPGEFLIVFASGKDRRDPENPHTNFKLDGDGEPVLLSDPGGTRVDSVHTGFMISDISEGRLPAQGPEWFRMEHPSPGVANLGPGYLDISLPPMFTLPTGLYWWATEVGLYHVVAGTEVRYTVGGRLPTETDPLYTEPLAVDSTTVLRARAWTPGKLPSATITGTYLVGEASSLPIVSLSTDPSNLWDPDIGIHVVGTNGDPNWPHDGANFFQNWERPVHVEVFEPGGETFAQDAGFKIFGGSSRLLPQKSFRLIARTNYGDGDFDYPFFPDRPFDEYDQAILRNSGQDWCLAHFRDGVIQRMAWNLDIDLMAFRPAVTFLNGEYWGILNLRERQNEDYLAAHHGVDPDAVDILRYPYNVIEGDDQPFRDLIGFIDGHPLDEPANYAVVEAQIEIPSFIDYNVMNIYVGNVDWPGANTKYWQPQAPGGKWRYLAYDLDAGLDLDWVVNGPDHDTLRYAIDKFYPSNRYPLRALLESAEFRQDFINAFVEHMDTDFHPEAMLAQTDAVVAEMDADIGRHMERWGYGYSHWTASMVRLRDFIEERPLHMLSHLTTCFGLGDTIRIDLSVDPPGAGRMELTAITVDLPHSGRGFANLPFRLRAVPELGYDFLGWSDPGLPHEESITVTALADTSLVAVFRPDELVAINEINCRSADEFDPGDWVELVNRTQRGLDMEGWHFRDENDDHDFEFPPGSTIPPHGYLVLCEDAALFRTLFPEVDNVVGGLNFGLRGSGELVRIYSPDMNLEDALTYGSNPPWPAEPDEEGPTLELIEPHRDNALPGSWANSRAPHGTPCAVNSVSPVPAGDPAPPAALTLRAPFPNPFNPVTRIRFGLPRAGRVRAVVYDLRGRRVDEPLRATLAAGWHEFTWNARGRASGVYFLRLEQEGTTHTRKLLLLK